MADCVFCKIALGELPSRKVYEDDAFYAFLDRSPINAGHTLIIPKEHHATLLDLPSSISSKMLEAVKRVASAVLQGTNADGFNLQLNNGEAAGQIVGHVHFHIIPRFKGDGLKLWQGRKDVSDEENDSVCKKIVSFI